MAETLMRKYLDLCVNLIKPMKSIPTLKKTTNIYTPQWKKDGQNSISEVQLFINTDWDIIKRLQNELLTLESFKKLIVSLNCESICLIFSDILDERFANVSIPVGNHDVSWVMYHCLRDFLNKNPQLSVFLNFHLKPGPFSLENLDITTQLN